MIIKLKSSDLQADIYKYIWKRDAGDGSSKGKQDRIRVDKDEGYEVLYFLQSLINDLKITEMLEVNKLEDILQDDDLSAMVMRDDLEKEVTSKFKYLKAIGLV